MTHWLRWDEELGRLSIVLTLLQEDPTKRTLLVPAGHLSDCLQTLSGHSNGWEPWGGPSGVARQAQVAPRGWMPRGTA